MRYRVSKAAVPSRRDHKLHLVQTTRLEPQPCPRSSSRSSSRQRAAHMKGSEELIVTEADFRRCGKSLTLMRQCQLGKLPPRPIEEAKNEMELSFKSAFVKRCQSQDHPIRDPWKDLRNPEETRQASEGDLVLNQVWADQPVTKVEEYDDDEEETLTPLTSGRSRPSTHGSRPSTRASSVDAVSARSHRDRQMDKQEARTRSRKSSRRPPSQRRAHSHSGVSGTSQYSAVTELPSTPPLSSGGRESRGRRAGHASGCPKPGLERDSSAKAKTTEYVSRIQVLDPDSQ